MAKGRARSGWAKKFLFASIVGEKLLVVLPGVDIQRDVDVDARSSAGWTALQEAVHARDHAIARRLIVASDQRAKAALRAKKPELLRRVYVCFGRHRSPSDRVRVVHAIR